MNGFARLTNFFGLKRNLVILFIAIFVIGAGEELWMRFVPKYLLAVGATVFVIGLYDALRTLLGAIYAYPGGVLVDIWGHRRAFIIFNLVSIVGYVLVLLVPHWAAVIAGMFLFLSWTCFSLPATFSLIGAALEANRHSMGVGVQSVIKRLPIMIAPFFGGILIDRFGIIPGVRIALVVSVFFSAGTILLQRQLREEPKERVQKSDRLEFLAKLARVQFAHETVALKRHLNSFLRTNSVCVGGNFRDGLHRRQWPASRHPNRDRNACFNVMHHPRRALRRSIPPRAIRDRDLCHVHAFSDQPADGAKFFGARHRILHSRPEGVRRYIAQGAYHWI